MALIDSTTYKILNASTVLNILNSKTVQTTSYPHIRSSFFDAKKSSTSDYKVIIKVKSAFVSNKEKIYDDIVKLFSVDVLLSKTKILVTSDSVKKPGIDFSVNLQHRGKNLKIIFPSGRAQLPEILRPGVLNEEYFASKIDDCANKLQEVRDEIGLINFYNPRLYLVLHENFKEKFTLGPVKSAERVGQELGKTDVKIRCIDGKIIDVSLKKDNFSFWSSASTYSPAKAILDHLIKTQQVTLNKSSNGMTQIFDANNMPLEGIKSPATVGEIKKFCFGEGKNNVDYVIISSFSSNDFSDLQVMGTSGEDYKIGIYANVVYTESSVDIERMKDNVYLTISSSTSNSSALSPYTGLKIEFTTANKSSKYYMANLRNSSVSRL